MSPYKSPATGYLVVEGFISGNTPTQFSLSRSIGLPGDSTIPVVTGATVQVEGSDNSVYVLAGLGNGIYSADSLTLNAATQYRLRISIPGGETYLSAYVRYKPSPPIDSINWIQTSSGVTIYVNTHDPADATHYYQWTYDQTWEYYVAEVSGYLYVSATNSVAPRTDSQLVYHCWQQDVRPTSILVGSSAKLNQDVIQASPLITIPANTQPLAVLYSILVRQYALTDSAYNFLSLMKLNTEDLGSIFDAQPSQPAGNIRSLSNPAEPVIGYVSAGTVQQKRIFIAESQLYDWIYQDSCPGPDIIIPNLPDSLRYYFGRNGTFTPIAPSEPTLPITGYFANYSSCLNCTLQGGTTMRPSFWPN